MTDAPQGWLYAGAGVATGQHLSPTNKQGETMHTQETIYAFLPSETLIRMAINDGTPLEIELARRLQDYRNAIDKVCAHEPAPHKLDVDGTPMFLRAQAV